MTDGALVAVDMDLAFLLPTDTWPSTLSSRRALLLLLPGGSGRRGARRILPLHRGGRRLAGQAGR